MSQGFPISRELRDYLCGLLLGDDVRGVRYAQLYTRAWQRGRRDLCTYLVRRSRRELAA